MNRWMSYRELDQLSTALGAWLQSQGLQPGSRVAIMLPNVPQFAVSMAAILRAGYTCVNVNPLYTARELSHQLKDSGSHMTLVPNPRDFDKFIEVLKQRPFHMLPGVNTLFNALMQHPMFKTIDFSTLKLTQAGGMAASEGTARHWHAATGSTMIEGWGMSETCAIGTNNP
eukprot:gene8055-7885_t